MILKSLYKSVHIEIYVLEYAEYTVVILVRLMRHQTEIASVQIHACYRFTTTAITAEHHMFCRLFVFVAMFHKHVHVFICAYIRLSINNVSTVADRL